MNDINQNEQDPISEPTTEAPETSPDETAAAAAPETEPETEDAQAKEIAALEEKVKATHERLLRTAADLDNVRKRAKRDVDEALARGRSEVLHELLPVLDSIDLALATKDADGANESILEGVQMTRKLFFTATERFGLRTVESLGRSFDPNFHEAVAYVASAEHGAGQIMDEMRKGYMLGEKLLRPAMVVVSKGEPGPSEQTGDTPQGDDNPNTEEPS